MSAQTFATKARKHWTKWLPAKVKALNDSGALMGATQAAGKMAEARMLDLMQQGYRSHEAEEVALAEFVLLPPEQGAGVPAWETQELENMEKAHRKAMAD